MAVTIHVVNTETVYRNEPYVIFWRTWIWYFAFFDASYKIQKLTQIPFYDDEVFDLDFCRQLQEEIPKLLFLVKHHSLPCFPPQTDPEDEIGEETILTYNDAEEFLTGLATVVDTAISEQTSIITVGD